MKAVLLAAAAWTLSAQENGQQFASLGDLKLESGGVTEQLAGNFGAGRMIDWPAGP